jgi:hypothetical protein
MKKVVRLTESDLVKLVNKVLEEQMISTKGLSSSPDMSKDSKGKCKPPSSPKELESKVLSQVQYEDDLQSVFYSFKATPQILSRLKGIDYGAFTYDKASNTISLYDTTGYFRMVFTGQILGDFLVKIKMPINLLPKLPKEFFDESMVPTFELESGRIKLLMTGLC